MRVGCIYDFGEEVMLARNCRKDEEVSIIARQVTKAVMRASKRTVEWKGGTLSLITQVLST